MNKKPSFIPGARLALLLPILVMLASGGSPRSASAGEPAPTSSRPEKVRVVIAPFLSYAPLWIALKEGFFAEQDLDVEVVTLPRSSEGLAALAGGKVDVLAGHILPAHLNLIARSGRVRFVADKGHLDPDACAYEAILASRAVVASGRLRDRSGLRGLRLAAERSSADFYYFQLLLSSAGLVPSDVEMVDVPSPAEAEAFRNGAIDVATSAEPWTTRILEEGDAVLWIPAQELVPGFQSGLVLYGPTLLEENREVGRRFMVEYLRGVRQYNEGKTERNVALVAEGTGLDVDLVRKACWISVRADGAVDTSSVLRYEEWALGQGLLDRVLAVEEFWDPSFVQYASGRLDSESAERDESWASPVRKSASRTVRARERFALWRGSISRSTTTNSFASSDRADAARRRSSRSSADFSSRPQERSCTASRRTTEGLGVPWRSRSTASFRG
jgi:NitT/TauT family transport system substrate-binding protein